MKYDDSPRNKKAFYQWLGFIILIFLCIFVIRSCSRPDSDESQREAMAEQSLADALHQQCLLSTKTNAPMLLEFTAPWCPDCVRLTELKREEPLRSELERWKVVKIDVGRFDRHTELLVSFGVKAIANWTVVRPSNCALPATSWPRLGRRTLEPVSRGETFVGPHALEAWLKGFRLQTNEATQTKQN